MEKGKNSINLKLILMVIFIIFLLTSVVVLKINAINNIYNSSIVKSIDVVSGNVRLKAASEEQIDVGKKGVVSSSVILTKTTGTGPFDENDDPGNDSSASNDIVRSFDQITWTLENTMSIKSGMSGSNLYGGIICIEASLPENCANLAKWDVASMGWAENATVSTDGRTLYAEYSLSDDLVTIPGKQNLVVVLKVLGAPNGLELNPIFKVFLYGNDEADKCTINDPETTIVSAYPRLNLKLYRNTTCNTPGYFDFVGNNRVLQENLPENIPDSIMYGRLQGYGVTVQVRNTSSSKGLKGLEMPTGDITFDIVLNELVGTVDKTFDNDYYPVMWDYAESMSGTTRGKNGRVMRFDGIARTSYGIGIPYNSGGGNYSCYSGGNFTIVQDETNTNVYHVTLKNYKFHPNYKFPPKNSNSSAASAVVYPEYIGCFSSLYFQTLLHFPKEVDSVTSIYNKVTVNNIRFTSISGVEGNTETTSSDSVSNANISVAPASSFSKSQHWHIAGTTTINVETTTNLSKTYTGGDAFMSLGSELTLSSAVGAGTTNDDVARRINVLQKFDDEGLEPLENASIDSGFLIITTNSSSTKGDLVTLYAAKPDKTGWIDDDEMMDTREEQLIYFDSYSALKAAGYVCVGYLLENTNIKGYRSSTYYYGFPLKVKDTAEIGKVYQTINDVRVWTEVDNGFTWLYKDYTYDPVNGLVYNNIDYPTPNVEKYTGVTSPRYIKTAYDENMQIIPGTHNSHGYGNSLLVIGADLKVSKTVTDTNSDGTKKVNYDIGKNEIYVNYQVNPRVENEDIPIGIAGITLRIKDTLPVGLTYVPGTSNYGEPEIITNGDGSTALIWYIYNVSINGNITPITYRAHIDEESPNGKQYETVVVAEEVVGTGEISKIGSGYEEDRMANHSIQIINLASYAFYKTTDTPIIELNGDIHYKLTTINKTDEPILNYKSLDILPYNGDGRGTSFSGSYTIARIEAKQVDTTTNAVLNNNNLVLKISNADSARQATINDENLGSGWTTATFGSNLNRALKAFCVNGTLEGRVRLELDIYIKTTNNKAEDKYFNMAYAQTSLLTEPIQTVLIQNTVVKRYIEGVAWFDANKDGLLNNNEELLQNVNVSLFNENGTVAKDINNNNIPAIRTNSSGYYKFEDVLKGNYYVQVTYEDTANEKEITLKEVGSNKEINNKFNANGRTDVINTLNALDAPIICEKNVNVGITYLDTSVLVHHYIINPDGTRTTNKVPLRNGTVQQDVVINGIIHDRYTANSSTNIVEYYELDQNNLPSNATGEMTKAQKVVTFYYRLKKYPYTVNYYEKLSNGTLTTTKIINSKVVPDNVWGTEIQSQTEKIDINGYTFAQYDKNTLTIGVDNNFINIYYERRHDLSYSVKYLEQGTNEVVAPQKNVPNRTFEDAITENAIDVDGYTKINPTTKNIIIGTGTNEIIFYYEKRHDLSYKVQYLEQGTNRVLAEEKTVNNKTFKERVSESAVDVDGFTKLAPSTQNLEITTNEATNLIVFYYEKRNDLTYNVKYLEQGTNRVLADEKFEGNRVFEEEITEVAVDVDGFDKIEPISQKITIGTGVNEIIFYYEKRHDLSYNVKYLEQGTNRVLSNEKIETNRTFEEEITEVAVDVEGFDKIEPISQKITIGTGINEIIFYYEKRSDLSYTVRYLEVGTENEIAASKTINNRTFEEEITEYARNVEGFERQEPTSKTIQITTGDNEIVFTYLRKTDLTYIVRYIDEENSEEIAEPKIVENQIYGDRITEQSIEIDGYIISGAIERILTIRDRENEIVFYYTRSGDIKYTVEYYFDDVIDDSLTENFTARNKDIIETYPDKNKDGYKLGRDNLPLTISVDESQNIVRVYYVKDDTQSRMLSYTVEYYKNNELVSEDTEKIEKPYWILGPNIIDVDINNINTNDKYIGYVCERTEPEVIPEKVEDGSVIKVFYTSDKFRYRIEYYFDNVLDEELTETLIARCDEVITEYEDKVKPDYELEGTVNLPLTITEKEEKNVIKIYYTKVKFGYKVEYYYDEIKDPSKTETYDASVGDVITEYEDKVIVGYKLDKKENIPLTISENSEENIIRIYYTKNNYKYRVEYYFDNILDDTLTEELTAKYGDVIETYKDKVKEFYMFDSEENVPLVISEKEDENVIRVYYVRKPAEVIVHYIDKYSGEEIEERVIIKGEANDDYETHEKQIEGYELITEEYPNNAKGKMTEELINVNYYYAKQTDVRVMFIDVDSNEELSEQLIIPGKEGDYYKVIPKEIEDYMILEDRVPENREGTMKENEIIVKYYYAKKAVLIIRHIDVKTGEEIEEEKYTRRYNTTYLTDPKELDDYKVVVEQLPDNKEGILDKKETIVTYYYKKATKVIERHIDNYDNTILEEKIYEGYVDDDYNTKEKTFDKYELMKDKYPNNNKGKMTEEEIIVNYYYQKKATITVEYRNKDTNEKIESDLVITDYRGKPYEAKRKDIRGYVLIEYPAQEKGTIDGDKVLVYYYRQKQTGNNTNNNVNNQIERQTNTTNNRTNNNSNNNTNNNSNKNKYVANTILPNDIKNDNKNDNKNNDSFVPHTGDKVIITVFILNLVIIFNLSMSLVVHSNQYINKKNKKIKRIK